MGNTGDTSKFQSKVDFWYMKFSFDGDRLDIIGTNQKYDNKLNGQGQKSYAASYDNLSLLQNQQIFKQFGSVKDLTQKIFQYRSELKIQNDCLIVMVKTQNSGKPYWLPLVSKQQPIPTQLQANLQNKTHPFQIVMQKHLSPYNCSVCIVANCPKIGKIVSSGTIIAKNAVFTVAHSVHNRQHNDQATMIQVSLFHQGVLKSIRVKKHFIKEQYRKTNLTDYCKYDFAILILEDNSIIDDSMIAQVKFNWVGLGEIFQMVGFSEVLDKKHSPHLMQSYHSKCKVLGQFETYMTFDGRTQPGLSGAGLFIFQDNKFKLIGIHQGLHVSLSRALLLTSFSQNPYQIISGLIKDSLLNVKLLPSPQSQEQLQKNNAFPQAIKLANLLKKAKQDDLQKEKQFLNLQKLNKILLKKRDSIEEQNKGLMKVLKQKNQQKLVKFVEIEKKVKQLRVNGFKTKDEHDYQEAEECYKECLVLLELEDKKWSDEYLEVVQSMIQIKTLRKSLKGCIKYYQILLEVTKKIKSSTSPYFFSAYYHLGLYNYIIHNDKNALFYFQQAQKIHDLEKADSKIHQWSLQSIMYFCLADLNRFEQKYQKSISYFNIILKDLEDTKNGRQVKNQIMIQLAFTYIMSEKKIEGNRLFQQVQKQRQKLQGYSQSDQRIIQQVTYMYATQKYERIEQKETQLKGNIYIQALKNPKNIQLMKKRRIKKQFFI